jgi:DNA-binding FadR family transcriptional regulator
VRYNTLMVVTHLVLNDMIKVKGQVSHVANSLNDDCEHIRELAKLFFVKLSERSNNPVYNLLGDIISIFSQDTTTTTSSSPSSSSSSSDDKDNKDNTSIASAHSNSISIHLSREQFETTMHFLLSFVQKDK